MGLPTHLGLRALLALALALSVPVGVALTATPQPIVTTDHGPIYLGTAEGVDGGSVEGYMFVLTAADVRRVERGPQSRSGPSCFAVFAPDTRWRSVEPYEFDASNDQGLDESTLAANFAGDIARWESAAGRDIFGAPTTTADPVTVDRDRPDGRNEVVFGAVEASNVVAVTVLWGRFSGSSDRREITEWDMAFDAEEYDWSLTGAADALDFDSVATHELGHALGLAHPPADCTRETMYEFTEPGTTAARTLEAGDRAGLAALYPNATADES